MRGSPLIRGLLAFLFILLLGIPIWKLTGESAPRLVAAPVSVPPAQKATVGLRLSFTATPSTVKVLHLGQEIWSAMTPAQEVEQQLQLEYPEEGVDLQFDVEWPNDSLSAIKVVLTDPEGNQHERSLWGQGSISEVLTFR